MNKPLIKRTIKSIRNLFFDPLPRNKTLSVEEIENTSAGFRIRYRAKQKDYWVSVEMPEELVVRFNEFDEAALQPTMCAIAWAFSAFFFKISDFRTVSLASFAVDSESSRFFSHSIQGGLGEFRYLQGLDPRKAIHVTSPNSKGSQAKSLATRDHLLMLNGGGKDTIVAGEMLRHAGQEFSWVTIKPNKARRSVVELSGNPSSIELWYQVDENIEKDRAYPWAHIPHTSIVLSLGLLVAQLTGARYVCAGNEQSANFGNIDHRGFEVNHQYTKSFKYEKGFYDYVHRCVSTEIHVFSILRPFHDLQLAMLFSQMKNYHSRFLSCNRGAGRDEWCGSCPKCAFTALALYPFIGPDGCSLIFGRDILHSPVTRQHIVDLATARIKPWECVGTQEESKLALKMVLDNEPRLTFDSPPFRSDLEEIVAGFDKALHEKELLESTCQQHLIPSEIIERLNTALTSLKQPPIPSLRIQQEDHHEGSQKPAQLGQSYA